MAEKPSGEPRGSEDPKDFADDVWEKFVRDSELGIGTSDAPKEPSARARMVTERLRQQDARGETPPGWRTGPDLQGMGGRPARRRKLWAIIGVPVVLALALVAMKPSLLPGDPFGTGGTGAESAAPLPEETAPPSTAPSAAPGTPTLDQPFAGSPAARYADGAAGIVLPEAKPVGSFGKDEVERALKQTKALLVDANLDRKTLLGGTPETVLGILDPKQPQMLSDVRSWLRKPDKENDPLLLFSRFDKGEVRLVGDVVKTRGRMTFEPGRTGPSSSTPTTPSSTRWRRPTRTPRRWPASSCAASLRRNSLIRRASRSPRANWRSPASSRISPTPPATSTTATFTRSSTRTSTRGLRRQGLRSTRTTAAATSGTPTRAARSRGPEGPHIQAGEGPRGGGSAGPFPVSTDVRAAPVPAERRRGERRWLGGGSGVRRSAPRSAWGASVV